MQSRRDSESLITSVAEGNTSSVIGEVLPPVKPKFDGQSLAQLKCNNSCLLPVEARR